jgi:hypothetical protein
VVCNGTNPTLHQGVTPRSPRLALECPLPVRKMPRIILHENSSPHFF